MFSYSAFSEVSFGEVFEPVTGSSNPTIGGAVSASVASFTQPSYVGSSGAVVGGSFSSALAQFSQPVFTGVGAGTVGGVEAGGNATFILILTVAPHLCSAYLVVPHGTAYIQPHSC